MKYHRNTQDMIAIGSRIEGFPQGFNFSKGATFDDLGDSGWNYQSVNHTMINNDEDFPFSNEYDLIEENFTFNT